MLAISTMDSQKEKGNTFGQQEPSTKEISKMATSMALENGKKEWEMEQISTKASTSKINAVATAPSPGASQVPPTGASSKKTL